jgi:hypothetical protein
MADLLNSNEIFFTQFEPKVKNRFLLYCDGIPSFLIRKVKRPTVTSEKKTLDHINIQRYYKGKTTWGSMTLELYDPIVPSGAKAVMEWVRLHHESVTGRDGYSDFYKKDLTINVLGPVGDIISEWVIKGAFIVNSNFGEYSWDNESVAQSLTVEVAMDYCVLNF